MKTFSLFQEIDLSRYRWEAGTHSPHKHNFFEIVYIFDGQGYHHLNENHAHAYHKGDLFLLTPGDVHSLEVTAPTEFCVLVFNKIYFTKEAYTNKTFSSAFQKIEFILHNASYLQQPIFKEEGDRSLMDHLIKHLEREYSNKETFFETIIQSAVLQILCLIARKIRDQVVGELLSKGADTDIAEVIFYIQEQINDSDKIKIENLAAHFNKSKNQFTDYFKSATGYSAKEYILMYKLNMIKHMLIYSSLNIAEIAFQLGFTDENHLNKFIKARLGMTATKFRTDQKKQRAE